MFDIIYYINCISKFGISKPVLNLDKTVLKTPDNQADSKIELVNLWNLTQQRCGYVGIRRHLQSESEFLNLSL